LASRAFLIHLAKRMAVTSAREFMYDDGDEEANESARRPADSGFRLGVRRRLRSGARTVVCVRGAGRGNGGVPDELWRLFAAQEFVWLGASERSGHPVL